MKLCVYRLLSLRCELFPLVLITASRQQPYTGLQQRRTTCENNSDKELKQHGEDAEHGRRCETITRRKQRLTETAKENDKEPEKGRGEEVKRFEWKT